MLAIFLSLGLIVLAQIIVVSRRWFARWQESRAEAVRQAQRCQRSQSKARRIEPTAQLKVQPKALRPIVVNLDGCRRMIIERD